MTLGGGVVGLAVQVAVVLADGVAVGGGVGVFDAVALGVTLGVIVALGVMVAVRVGDGVSLAVGVDDGVGDGRWRVTVGLIGMASSGKSAYRLGVKFGSSTMGSRSMLVLQITVS